MSTAPSWEESIDAALLARLLRPLRAPGIVSTVIPRRILGWVRYFSGRLPLLDDLTARRGDLRTEGAPIVYGVWVVDSARDPVTTTGGGRPSAPSSRTIPASGSPAPAPERIVVRAEQRMVTMAAPAAPSVAAAGPPATVVLVVSALAAAGPGETSGAPAQREEPPRPSLPEGLRGGGLAVPPHGAPLPSGTVLPPMAAPSAAHLAPAEPGAVSSVPPRRALAVPIVTPMPLPGVAPEPLSAGPGTAAPHPGALSRTSTRAPSPDPPAVTSATPPTPDLPLAHEFGAATPETPASVARQVPVVHARAASRTARGTDPERIEGAPPLPPPRAIVRGAAPAEVIAEPLPRVASSPVPVPAAALRPEALPHVSAAPPAQAAVGSPAERGAGAVPATSAAPRPVATPALPVVRRDAVPPETTARASYPDVDTLVEKVERQLLRRLAAERERRGGLA